MMIRKIHLLLILLFAMAGCVPVSPVSAQQEPVSDNIERLWIDLSMGPEFVDWFNQVARPGDIARIDHLEMLNLLDEITAGQTLVVFKSIAEAEQTLPSITGKVDIIGYNIEHGPANPQSEQRTPAESVRRMKSLANRYNVRLAVGPDHDFAVSDGVAMAVYADIMILQIQRAQTDAEMVRGFILPLIPAMRLVNPQIEISVQVGAQGDVLDVSALVRSFATDLDGISILTDHETTSFVTAFVEELRPPRYQNLKPIPGVSRTPVPAAAQAVPVTPALPTETAASTVTDAGSPGSELSAQLTTSRLSTPQPPVPAALPQAIGQAAPSVSSLLFLAGSLMAFMFFGGLVVAIILHAFPLDRFRLSGGNRRKQSATLSRRMFLQR